MLLNFRLQILEELEKTNSITVLRNSYSSTVDTDWTTYNSTVCALKTPRAGFTSGEVRMIASPAL